MLNISTMVKKRKNFNKKSIRGLYVGRLDELKNIDSLIKSFQFIDNKNITLDIYGQGDLKNFWMSWLKIIILMIKFISRVCIKI